MWSSLKYKLPVCFLSLQLPSMEDRPPPYNNTETGNAPPVLTAGASAVPGSEGGSVGKLDV